MSLVALWRAAREVPESLATSCRTSARATHHVINATSEALWFLVERNLQLRPLKYVAVVE